MKHSIVQNQLKLTQKLHNIFPEIKTVISEKLDFNEDITNLYYSKKKRYWFSKIEQQGKAYYIFGNDKSRNVIRKSDILLIIDIDLNHEYNPDCLGRLVKIGGELKLLLNIDVFKKRYPQIDDGLFSKSNITSHENSMKYIDFGFISKGLIGNLEILLSELEKEPVKKPVVKVENDKCKICAKNQFSVKIDHHLHKIHLENPEFCGECLEKIIACEFYAKIKSQLKGNETKTLNIAREKFANDELFDYGLKLLEKYSILRYIGVKKLLFTIDTNNNVLKQYNQYAKSQLLDLLTIKNNNLTPMQFKMNKFLDALVKGKTHEEAYKIANIHPKTFKQWYQLGHDGNKDYIDFYDNYKEFEPPRKELKLFIKTLKEYRNLKKTLRKCKTDIETVRKWYDKGKEGIIDYKWFYQECHKILPQGIRADDNSDYNLISRYMELRNSGKTNSQAIDELGIPQEKIDEWIAQAKKGNKKYTNFYTAYHEKDVKCEVCGRKINKNSNKKICRRCEKKRFAAKILLKILNIIEAGKTFKKDELELLNLKPMQITEYLWTLKEFNLITEKNNKYQLKSRTDLEEFLKSTGIDTSDIPEHTNDNLYRTCNKCERKLPKSKFINDEDTCKDCKKQINTAKYLTEIMEHVDCNTKFSENDLKAYFKNPLKLQARIWALVDSNLAKKNFDDNTYTLGDEKTVSEFLSKYGDGEIIKTHKDKGILSPLPEGMKGIKVSKTGFAWVNKVGKKYYYTRKYSNKQVRISGETINDLYEKVKGKGELWGVSDLDNAKATLRLIESEFKDPGIYAPLPVKYAEKFSKKTNQTGIAWVNKIGNNFIYSRSVNGKNIRLKDSDITELYRKVKSKNQVWGIRDYDNASKYIEIPENSKKGKVTEIDPKIYAPLKERYMKNFRKENETGIAWVNKSGNNYIYTRNVNGKINTFSDPDIYELYHKVKSKNQVWGIRDYRKASKIIDIPESLIEDDEAETGFYSQLPEKYLKNCDETNTGIAWVNKINEKWIYNLKIKDKIIRLTDTDVNRLHEKVLNNNGIWGITDLKKAKKTVENKVPENKKVKSSNINVNFIQKTKSKYDVIIKGTIRSNQLFKILKQLEEYENSVRRIMTTTIRNDVDLFIEMEMNLKSKKDFEEKNKEYGWKIN